MRFLLSGASTSFATRAAATSTGNRLGSERFLRNTFGYDPPIPEIPRAQIEPLPPTL